MRMNHTCETCGVRFTVIPSKVGRTRFCSRACKYTASRAPADAVCPICGVEFLARKRTEQRFCSLRCAGVHRRTASRIEYLHQRSVREPSGCLLWTGHVHSSGYGRIVVDRRDRFVHCVAWEEQHGPIPPGMQVQHLCNVKRCIEPTHLTLGTPAQNSAYMVQCGRSTIGDRNGSRLD